MNRELVYPLDANVSPSAVCVRCGANKAQVAMRAANGSKDAVCRPCVKDGATGGRNADCIEREKANADPCPEGCQGHPDEMTDTGSKAQAERCYYYADGSDYRCRYKVGHDGPHRHKGMDASTSHMLVDFACRCPDCKAEQSVPR